MGVELNVDTTEVAQLIGRTQKRLGDAEPAFAVIGETVLASIRRNFEEGGRPKSWKKLASSTEKARKKAGKWPGQILVMEGTRGGLLGSISYEAVSDRVVISANKVYAAIHHFGGRAGRGHKTKIPARPYMLIQDEDWVEIKETLADYIMGLN